MSNLKNIVEVDMNEETWTQEVMKMREDIREIKTMLTGNTCNNDLKLKNLEDKLFVANEKIDVLENKLSWVSRCLVGAFLVAIAEFIIKGGIV